MSHEITKTDATFSVREMPWMGLLDGQVHVLPEHPTREEAQRLVHPWEPIEVPVFKRVPQIAPDGTLSEEYVEIEGQKALERSDNGATLAVVNSTLGVITNTHLWDVAEAVGEVNKDIAIETGGSLDEGRKVWALMRFMEPLQIKGDPHGASVAFLAIQNTHNATGSFRAQGVNTRIVCANTSAAADAEAKRNGYEFRFRHSSKVAERIEEAKAAVAMWRDGVTAWQNVMEHLVTVKVTDEQVKEFVERFQPMPPSHLITDRVRGNVEKARGQVLTVLNGQTVEGVERTAYGLFQGAIEWEQHVRRVAGRDQRSRMESYFKRNMLDDSGLRAATLSLVKEVAKA